MISQESLRKNNAWTAVNLTQSFFLLFFFFRLIVHTYLVVKITFHSKIFGICCFTRTNKMTISTTSFVENSKLTLQRCLDMLLNK